MVLYISLLGLSLFIIFIILKYNNYKKTIEINHLPRLQLLKPINTKIIDENLELVIGKMYDVKINGIYLWTYIGRNAKGNTGGISMVLKFDIDKVIKYEVDGIYELRPQDASIVYGELLTQDLGENSPHITTYKLERKNISARFRIEKGSYIEIDGKLTASGLSLNLIHSVVNYIRGGTDKTILFENANFEFFEI